MMAATYCLYICLQLASAKKSSCVLAVGLQETNWSTLPVLFQLLVKDKITCRDSKHVDISHMQGGHFVTSYVERKETLCR